MSELARPESAALYDALAPDYESHFDVPHRRAYDDLAWNVVVTLLPDTPATVIDVGCGIGRWADRIVGLGHRMIGIEAAHSMAERARARSRALGTARFEVIEAPMEHDQPALVASADVVLAMGSLQYAADVDAVLGRFHSWLRPGGAVAALVDSLGGLVAALVHEGRSTEAVDVARSRRGHWEPPGAPGADLHLFDRVGLTEQFERAGFTSVRAHGLLVSGSICGVPAFVADLAADRDAAMIVETALAEQPALADLGKQLLVTARRPA